MNICFLTSEFPNLRSGGVENVTYRLIKEFIARGHNVSCISSDAPSSEMDIPFRHLCIRNLSSPEKSISAFFSANNVNIVINQSIELQWRFILDKIKPNFSHVKFIKTLHTDPYYAIKSVRDIEPLYVTHGNLARLIYRFSPVTFLRYYRRYKYLRSLYQDWIYFYDAIVLLSSRVLDSLKKITGLYAHHKLFAINNPVDIGGCDNRDQRQKLVLFVGRLHRMAKRPDRVLAVWRKIYKDFPDWNLIFVGDGAMRHSLEKFCRDSGMSNVLFVGQCDPSQYYRKASILCVSSTSEGFSLVCAEALLSGVVPIAFDSYGAVKDLICNGHNGILVPPFDLDKYAKCLIDLMKNKEYLEQLRYNTQDSWNCDWASIDIIVNQWEDLFAKLI